jgi:hypothetical protein
MEVDQPASARLGFHRQPNLRSRNSAAMNRASFSGAI